MEYNEADYLQLSGIQHFRFCRRQWALIHIENQWAENSRTVGVKLCMSGRMIQSFGNGGEICSLHEICRWLHRHWAFPGPVT